MEFCSKLVVFIILFTSESHLNTIIWFCMYYECRCMFMHVYVCVNIYAGIYKISYSKQQIEKPT